jgi:hypothetical protein
MTDHIENLTIKLLLHIENLSLKIVHLMLKYKIIEAGITYQLLFRLYI